MKPEKIKLILLLSLLCFLVIITIINMTLSRHESELTVTATFSLPVPAAVSAPERSWGQETSAPEQASESRPAVVEYEPRLPEGAALAN